MTEQVAEFIKERRKAFNLSQEELAERSDLSRVSIGNYERGDRKVPPEILAKIAEPLGVSKVYLYALAGYLDETDIFEMVNENKMLRHNLGSTELYEAKARMEIERLRGIIINAGCAMAEGENGDAYRHLYNGIGNGDYNYFERINEEDEKKFSAAIKRRLAGEPNE